MRELRARDRGEGALAEALAQRLLAQTAKRL